MKSLKHSLKTAMVILFSSSLSGCVVSVYASDPDADFENNNGARHGKSVSSVIGGITVERGATVGDLDSVNGGIDISDDVTADQVDTVNGSINMGDNVSVTKAETVNGRITSGKHLKVERSLETVNGNIIVKSGSDIGRDLVTVNGDILVKQSTVGGDVVTYTGDIDLIGSFINGNLSIKKSNNNHWFSWGKDKLPVVSIDSSTVIRGSVHLYREVELIVEDGAKVGEVVRHYTSDGS